MGKRLTLILTVLVSCVFILPIAAYSLSFERFDEGNFGFQGEGEDYPGVLPQGGNVPFLAGLEGLGDVDVSLQDAAIILDPVVIENIAMKDKFVKPALDRLEITDPNVRKLIVAMSVKGVTEAQITEFAEKIGAKSKIEDAREKVKLLKEEATINQFKAAKDTLSGYIGKSEEDLERDLPEDVKQILTQVVPEETTLTGKLNKFLSEITLEDYIK